MDVNIYIEMSTAAPRAMNMAGIYLLDAYADGKAVTVAGEPWVVYEVKEFGHSNNSTAALALLEAALERLQKVDRLTIYTKSENIYWTLANGWLADWKKNGWKSSRGVSIKYAEEWKRVERLLSKYTWSVSRDHHPWEIWMDNEIRKEGLKHVG